MDFISINCQCHSWLILYKEDNMSTNVTTDTQTNTGSEETVSLSAQANEFLRTAPVDESGKLVFGEDVPEELKVVVLAEKSRRDTQAAYTKAQQELKRVQAEKEALLAQIGGQPQLSAEDVEALEELKVTDPDKWFHEKVRLEKEARERVNQTVASATEEAGAKAAAEYELARRAEVLADFTKNTGFALTEDIVANDVPPRLTKKLEDGMEFGAWLYEVKAYLDTPKAVANETADPVTNIGTGGNGDTGSDTDNSDMSLEEMYAGAVI